MITQTVLNEDFFPFNIKHEAIGQLIVADPCELEDQFVRRRRRQRRARHGDRVASETQPGNGFMAIDCLVWDVIVCRQAACAKHPKWPEYCK